MRILGLDHLRVRWYASAASRSFWKTVRWSWARSAFLTNCCVMVEPPWTAFCWMTSWTKARPMPRMSTPELRKKRRSSMAMIASRTLGETSL